MPLAPPATVAAFQTAFRGRFSGLMGWDQLDLFWQRLRARADAGWHIYAIGLAPPRTAHSAADVERFVTRVDELLRHEHREEYCGIVYADNVVHPTFIKIFDPGHLGLSCGSSKHPPLPGWILSLLPPTPLEDKRVLPMNRIRWWETLWV
jgi:hypothetical protein